MKETVIRVNAQGQLTIPAPMRKDLGINGSCAVRLTVRKGTLRVTLLSDVVPGEERYHTKAWQKAVREAVEEHKSGKLKRYNSVEEMMADLERKVVNGELP